MNGTVTIKGGSKLVGEVVPIPNKNAILPALAASVLTDEDVIYHNVPKSTDVDIMLRILRRLGAEVNTSDYDNLIINCKGVDKYIVDRNLGSKFRSSIFLVGPLLKRFGKAKIPVPGGCVLGKRSVAAHVDVFQKVGVKVESSNLQVKFISPKKVLPMYVVWQSEASVSATENLFMYAAGTNATFSLTDAASEPHVSQLLKLLTSMGADVKGILSNKVIIHGTARLKGGEFTPDPDHVDVVGYIVAAAITNGNIRIKGANIFDNMGILLNMFPKFGVDVLQDGKDLVAKRGNMKINYRESGLPLAGDNLAKFSPRPWPGFPVDCLPPMVTLACKVDGQVLFNNWMYERGLDFIHELNKMGADIQMLDLQKVITKGPVEFIGGTVVTPTIIQACKAIFLAALCDPVSTTLSGVDILKRRYPNIFETYKSLGAKIEYLGG